jgi:T5SS/PEP-CTERM-associated repeat protein
VGEGGNGTLNILMGGLVASQDGAIGVSAGSSGTETVNRQKSAWNVTLPGWSGLLTIGENDSTGSLSVQAGGQVTASQITVNVGGTLIAQNGTVAANLLNAGGIISAGDATGIMTITETTSRMRARFCSRSTDLRRERNTIRL